VRPPHPGLTARYAEPHRRYHDLAHIEACLADLAAAEGLSDLERRILEFAIWWHDAVHDPARSDNEARSAELAERDLAEFGEDAEVRREVGRLIGLTKGHQVAPGDRLGALMVSIDLAILAARPGDYDAYARAIREEYAHVPETAFRAGRAAVLRRLLDREAIFPNPGFRARFEARARANLERELKALAA